MFSHCRTRGDNRFGKWYGREGLSVVFADGFVWLCPGNHPKELIVYHQQHIILASAPNPDVSLQHIKGTRPPVLISKVRKVLEYFSRLKNPLRVSTGI